MSIAARSTLTPKQSSNSQFFGDAKYNKRKQEEKEKLKKQRDSITSHNATEKYDKFWSGVLAISAIHIGDPKAMLKRIKEVRKPVVSNRI